MNSEVTRLASASRWSHSEKLGLPAALGARLTSSTVMDEQLSVGGKNEDDASGSPKRKKVRSKYASRAWYTPFWPLRNAATANDCLWTASRVVAPNSR
jgi:hypothetical protein